MTQNFIQAVQSAQPGVRILTLDNAEQVLKSVGRKQLEWTDSSFAKEPVASLYADTYGTISFDATDPKETYGQLIPQLVYANTSDFRPYYIYRKVK